MLHKISLCVWMLGMSLSYPMIAIKAHSSSSLHREHAQRIRVCGKDICAVKYRHDPPVDSQDCNSVSISKIEKGSRLIVIAHFNHRISKRNHLKPGYFTSRDRGKTWHLFQPLAGPSDSKLSVQYNQLFHHDYVNAPSNANILYRVKINTEERAGKKNYHSSFERSDDGGKIWKTMPTQAGGSSVRSVIRYLIHPFRPMTLYCVAQTYGNGWSNNYVYGLYKSEDGGSVLHLLKKEMGRACLAISPADPNIIFADGPDNHLMKSTDGGKVWEPVGQSEDLRTGYVLEKDRSKNHRNLEPTTLNQYQSIVHDPRVADIVYVVSEKGLLKTTDGGAHWRILDLGIENARAFNNLVVDPDDHNTLYAGTIYGLFKSTDQGCSWERIDIHKRFVR